MSEIKTESKNPLATKEFIIGPATKDDISAIIAILLANRDEPSLLQRSEREVSQYLKDFIVIRYLWGPVLGCIALHRYSAALAEVFSLAVAPDAQGQALGQRLMEACIQQAKANGIQKLWLATQKPGYFARFGYKSISRWELPIFVLFAKLRQILKRSPNTWLLTLFSRQTIMRLEL
jgi:amino-acid N-acetyltransferase